MNIAIFWWALKGSPLSVIIDRLSSLSAVDKVFILYYDNRFSAKLPKNFVPLYLGNQDSEFVNLDSNSKILIIYETLRDCNIKLFFSMHPLQFSSEAITAASRLQNCVVISEFHNNIYCFTSISELNAIKLYADHIIGLTEHHIFELERIFRHSNSKFHIVSNSYPTGVSYSKGLFVEEDMLEVPLKICIALRYCAQKNLSILYEFIRQNSSSYEFHLLGDGTFYEEFFNDIYNSGSQIQNIHFYGVRPREEALDIFRICDVVLLPTYYECQPLLLFESVITECLFVTSNVDGTNNIIQDAVNGFLFENDDLAGLNKKMSYISEHRYVIKNCIENLKSSLDSLVSKYKFNLDDFNNRKVRSASERSVVCKDVSIIERYFIDDVSVKADVKCLHGLSVLDQGRFMDLGLLGVYCLFYILYKSDQYCLNADCNAGLYEIGFDNGKWYHSNKLSTDFLTVSVLLLKSGKLDDKASCLLKDSLSNFWCPKRKYLAQHPTRHVVFDHIVNNSFSVKDFILDFLDNKKSIYGAGSYSRRLCKFLLKYAHAVEGIYVANPMQVNKEICGITAKMITEFDPDDSFLIVAVSYEYDKLIELFEDYQLEVFKDYIFASDLRFIAKLAAILHSDDVLLSGFYHKLERGL